MKPTLFVLAAGLGSRYGGLKQMDGIGPNGETIMEYSVYDAIRAGFGKVAFVIRHSFESEFRSFVDNRFGSAIETAIVFQELDSLPEGYSLDNINPGREKPWGTNHAVLMASGTIREPFCVINADDFYGRESYEAIAGYLTSVGNGGGKYAMVGYRVGNTLSESGSVARGVCETDNDGYLTAIVERTHIERVKDTIEYKDERGDMHPLEPHTPVSMNMWGFTPDYFDHSLEYFCGFLDRRGGEPKSEFFIPLLVNDLVKSGKASVKVLDTTAAWFGVTYKEDKPAVVAKLDKLIENNVYPSKLWK